MTRGHCGWLTLQCWSCFNHTLLPALPGALCHLLRVNLLRVTLLHQPSSPDPLSSLPIHSVNPKCWAMHYLRPMRVSKDDGLPVVGDRGMMLGARHPGSANARTFDVTPDSSGHVHPGLEGISLTAQGYDLPPHLSRSLRDSEGRVACFVISGEFFPTDDLDVRITDEETGHASMPPNRSMPLNDYQEALAGTRDLWERR